MWALRKHLLGWFLGGITGGFGCLEGHGWNHKLCHLPLDMVLPPLEFLQLGCQFTWVDWLLSPATTLLESPLLLLPPSLGSLYLLTQFLPRADYDLATSDLRPQQRHLVLTARLAQYTPSRVNTQHVVRWKYWQSLSFRHQINML